MGVLQIVGPAAAGGEAADGLTLSHRLDRARKGWTVAATDRKACAIAISSGPAPVPGC
jgi:hypothetical protein